MNQKENLLTFEEYHNYVFEYLKETTRVSDEEIKEYLASEEILKKLKNDYEEYKSAENITGASPAATAHCLEMMW